MKRLMASVAALIIALTSSGCMTNGLAKVVKELRQDTNSFRLRANGYGVTFELDRNLGGGSLVATDAGAGGVTLTPVTTLRVQQAK